jgi:hypothetical protein
MVMPLAQTKIYFSAPDLLPIVPNQIVCTLIRLQSIGQPIIQADIVFMRVLSAVSLLGTRFAR